MKKDGSLSTVYPVLQAAIVQMAPVGSRRKTGFYHKNFSKVMKSKTGSFDDRLKPVSQSADETPKLYAAQRAERVVRLNRRAFIERQSA